MRKTNAQVQLEEMAAKQPKHRLLFSVQNRPQIFTAKVGLWPNSVKRFVRASWQVHFQSSQQ
jgi:hypothetical protein